MAAGLSNCVFLLSSYDNLTDPRGIGGYYVDEWVVSILGTCYLYADNDSDIKKALPNNPTGETERTAIRYSNWDLRYYSVRPWPPLQNVCYCPTPSPWRYETFGIRGTFSFVAGNRILHKCSQWALSYGTHYSPLRQVWTLLIVFRYVYLPSTHSRYEDWVLGFLRHIFALSFNQLRKRLLTNLMAKSRSNKPLTSICLTIKNLKTSSLCCSKTRPREWSSQN